MLIAKVQSYKMLGDKKAQNVCAGAAEKCLKSGTVYSSWGDL